MTFSSAIAAVGFSIVVAASAAEPGLVKSEFIYDIASFPECHASTIAEVNGKLIASWFGGTKEGNKDVRIWVSRHDGTKWSAPAQVADGMVEGKQYPTWNPVLFRPRGQPLNLFYKVGPSPSKWWGMRMISTDDGATWSKPEQLAEGILGPIKNKPVQLANGDIISGSSTEHDGWRVHFERSTDAGKTWQKIGPVTDEEKFGAIQPTILMHKNQSLQALCRSKKGKIVETWSTNGGSTWSALTATSLPNPNSGIDAVTLKDGRHLLVYNHTSRGRSPINVAVTEDGRTWRAGLVLETEPGEYSYPAVIQAKDGLVHVTYTWKRQKVKHVVIDPAKLSNQ